jgi:hypothetical protein
MYWYLPSEIKHRPPLTGCEAKPFATGILRIWISSAMESTAQPDSMQ